jgi:ubiquinone/menaquinone biosynthesis C-methylase UbiE
MTAKPLPTRIVVQWMLFKEHAEQIMRLRHRVYCEAQGFSEDVISSEYDELGLHLGTFCDGELVSAISAYVYALSHEETQRFNLPAGTGRVVQYSKRVQLNSYRGNRVGQFLVTTMIRNIYELVKPRLAFFLLKGIHKQLANHYVDTLGFDHHATIDDPSGPTFVMTSIDQARLRFNYFKVRQLNEQGAATLGVPPSLVRFLDQVGWMDRIAFDKLLTENLYTAPLSLQDELPRLSAQTRLLLMEQKSHIAVTEFPPAPARMLDAGAGPGVYLSWLTRESKFNGYEFVGLDASAEMVAYARLSRPDVRWILGSIYATDEPDQSYDVVHANFLFLHLLSPALALREIYRILKPGGLLYVLDVNDSTFQAPPVISHLIELHANLCEGNRYVLNSLPGIAKEHSLSLVQTFSTRILNTAPVREQIFAGEELRFDRNTLWGLFSFIGQREELTEQFKIAQEYYFTSGCEMSVCIQTHVYRKVADESIGSPAPPLRENLGGG